ncbi:hypothetical protein OROGR_027335 [Orobanche gracilis]
MVESAPVGDEVRRASPEIDRSDLDFVLQLSGLQKEIDVCPILPDKGSINGAKGELLHKGTLIALHDKVPQSNIVVSVRQGRLTGVGDPKQVSSDVNSNIVNSKGIASDVVDSDPSLSKIVLDPLELDQGPLCHFQDYA